MAGALTHCRLSLKHPELNPLISSLMALLQPMHFMPPTTSRSFQTSVSRTPWTRQCWAWPSGQVHITAPPRGRCNTVHSALSRLCVAMSNMYNLFLPGMHTIAAQLLGSGASINDTMSNGQTLLHMAIQRQDSKSALFLLEHQADINVR